MHIKKAILSLALIAAGSMAAAVPAEAGSGRVGFGFNARDISGFNNGAVELTGGGSYNLSTGAVHSAGGFGCTAPVQFGQLAGCATGEGVRWDTVSLLRSTGFTCTFAAATGETAKTAVTDEHVAVLQADFYRAGDGNEESFTAKMFVADHDLAPDLAGVQNIWIQGIGCGTATVNFSS